MGAIGLELMVVCQLQVMTGSRLCLGSSAPGVSGWDGSMGVWALGSTCWSCLSICLLGLSKHFSLREWHELLSRSYYTQSECGWKEGLKLLNDGVYFFFS